MPSRDSQVLLANANTPTISLSPRLMHERQLTLVGGGSPTKPEMLAFLAAFEVHPRIIDRISLTGYNLLNTSAVHARTNLPTAKGKDRAGGLTRNLRDAKRMHPLFFF